MIAVPGWAGTPAALQKMLAYLPSDPDDDEQAYAVADAWWPPSPMAVPLDVCDRVLKAASEVGGTVLLGRTGREYFDAPVDPADLDAVCGRFLAANALWWRFDIVRWEVAVKQYVTGESYPPHIDIIPGATRRRLVGIVQLSEPDAYRGGELRIHFAQHTFTGPRARGSLISLPAWTEHEVTRVTAGERWVLLVGGNITGRAPVPDGAESPTG